MVGQRRSIGVVLAVLWFAPAAWADGAGRLTVARQNYAYSPRTDSVTLELATVYSGSDAEGFRALYGQLGTDGYSKAKLDYYGTMYSTVAEAAPPAVKDGGDTIETWELYAISLADPDDDELKHRFPIYPDLLRGFFSSLPPTVQQPYALDGTLERRDIVTVTAPTMGTYQVRDGAVAGGAFAFTRKATASAGRVELDYRLRFLASSVPVADYEHYRTDIERMDHNIYAWIDLDRDLYRRYSQDIPKIARAVAAPLLIAVAGLAYLVIRARRRAGRI
jgi:hypothetical protein